MIKKISWTIGILFIFSIVEDMLDPLGSTPFYWLSRIGNLAAVVLLFVLFFKLIRKNVAKNSQTTVSAQGKHEWLRLAVYIFLAAVAGLLIISYVIGLS